MRVDLTVVAIPAFLGSMAAEYAWQRKHPAQPGTRAGDYEFKDTMASLTMGVGSLLAPYLSKKLLDPVTPGRGRYAKWLMGTAVAATAITTVGDVLRRRYADGGLPEPGTIPGWEPPLPSPAAKPGEPRGIPALRRITAGSGLLAVASTAASVSTLWAAQTAGSRLFGRTGLDLGTGASAFAAGILGWDFIYYWNHRMDHECRWLWAMHVVHHSSERYNLSTALRQPVTDGLTMSLPYGILSLLGVRPGIIEHARALNLIYQFWIHTEAIRSIGWLEHVLNTPSHHRVHHGSNSQYLDRNHGSILIIWDRLFGTFEREDTPVVYGLTTDIKTFNPLRIASHEWVAMGRDIARSRTWRHRWSYLLRGPGWSHSPVA